MYLAYGSKVDEQLFLERGLCSLGGKLQMHWKQTAHEKPLVQTFISEVWESPSFDRVILSRWPPKLAAKASTVGVTFPSEVTLKYLRLELVGRKIRSRMANL